MSERRVGRAEAEQLLFEFTQGEALRRHGRAVEQAMRAYAGWYGITDPAEVEKWGIVGLLHDFDYEQNTTEETHLHVGGRILRERGYPEEVIHAILGHADYTGVQRSSALDHALFACDELSGFLTACALIKPSKSIHEVETSSVRKKLKDKAFARGVSRDDVYKGAEELAIPLEEHIAFCIAALRSVAPALGLDGSAAASA